MSISERRITNNRIRRQKELRKNIIFSLLTTCLIAMLSITANSFLSNAQSNSDDISYKYYKSIAINAGDTLWSIADKNMGVEYKDIESYINEVKRMNHLTDDTITVGSYLIVPYFTNEFVG